MAEVPLKIRIRLSLIALGVTWLLSAIVLAVYSRDVQAFYLFVIWPVPFYIVGWVLLGLPVVSLSKRPRHMLGFAVMFSVAGALVGGLLVLSPAIFDRLIDPQRVVPFAWTDLKSWPALGAANGAVPPLLYTWLLSRHAVSRAGTSPRR
jgi:hypothetical protein